MDRLCTFTNQITVIVTTIFKVCGDSYTVLEGNEITENDKMISDLQQELEASHAVIKEKEQLLTNLETQLNAALTEAREFTKVIDHSKGQSRRIMNVKQELDATKVMNTLVIIITGELNIYLMYRCIII